MVSYEPHPQGLSSRPSTRSRGGSRSAFSALVVALFGLLLAACSPSTGQAGPAPAGGSTTGQSSPFAYVGALPKTVEGADFDAAPLAGKPVVLWFWAPWCTICRGEAPTVRKIAEEYAGTVQFIGVSGQDTVPAMTRFVRETGVGSFTHLADTSGAIWREYGVAVQPAFAFINSDGKADVRVGSLDEQTLRARVAELAAGAPTSTISRTPGPTCSKAADGTLLCGSAGPGQPATTSAPVPTSAP
jgi:thiol-disulfide isomerase/thioredoxin